MSTEQLAIHALGRFLTDVIRPLRARLAHAVQEGCDWRVRWARSEAAEAQRFLLLGRTLGLYPAALAEGLQHSQADLWFEGGQAVAAWTHTLQADWQATNTLLEAHTLQPAFGTEGEALRRASTRAVALFQSNLLASSRLGHGLAAEALALLGFGHDEDCLRALQLVQFAPAASTPGGEALRHRLLAALDEPAAEPPADDDHLRGVALVASVFHAMQYTRALGYMHIERDTLTSDRPAQPDALLELMGTHTGDLLHATQFWRLNVLDVEFEHNFTEALRLAAGALFRLDPVVDHAQDEPGLQAFVDDVLQRWRPVAAAWGSIHVAPVAVGAATAGQRQEPEAGALSF